MQIITQIHALRAYGARHSRVAVIAMLLVFALFVLLYVWPEDSAPAALQVKEDGYVLTHATSVPLAIEGVLTAREDAVIAAQSQGRLASVPAREGTIVRAGDTLAVVGQPVLAAQRDALLAKIRAVEAQRDLAEVASDGARTIATVRASEGRLTLDAQVALAESEYRTAEDTLMTTLESGYLTATEALNFLADTTSLSNKDVAEYRDAAARSLGGAGRAQYLGPSTLSSGSTIGYLDELNALTGNTEADSVTRLALADRLLAGLATVASAYDAAERPAYERGSDVTEAERTSYNSYRTAVRTTQASVAAARGAYVTAQQGVVAARTGKEETVLVRESELEQASAMRDGESNVSSATLANLRAELRALDTGLGEAVVRAPYSGVITDVYVDQGSYVSPGTPIVRMRSMSGYEVESVVPERYLPSLIQGAEAVFADGKRGVLDRVAPQVDERTGGVSAFVVIDGEADGLVAGSRIRGELLLTPHEALPVYAIPHTYVSFDFTGPIVRTKDGVVPVTVVRDTREYLYVTGEGLVDGSALVY